MYLIKLSGVSIFLLLSLKCFACKPTADVFASSKTIFLKSKNIQLIRVLSTIEVLDSKGLGEEISEFGIVEQFNESKDFQKRILTTLYVNQPENAVERNCKTAFRLKKGSMYLVALDYPFPGGFKAVSTKEEAELFLKKLDLKEKNQVKLGGPVRYREEAVLRAKKLGEDCFARKNTCSNKRIESFINEFFYPTLYASNDPVLFSSLWNIFNSKVFVDALEKNSNGSISKEFILLSLANMNEFQELSKKKKVFKLQSLLQNILYERKEKVYVNGEPLIVSAK